MKHTLLVAALAAAVGLSACGKKEEAKPAAAAAPAAAEVTIAYITNGNTNEGWTLINGGAKKAGGAPGVKYIELAAEKGDLAKQLAIVEDMITKKVSAIAIAPVDSKGIAPAIAKAMAAGIPVVAVDTGIDGTPITSYVATDNIKAAMVQGDWAADQVADGDTVIYVTGDQGQSTGQERKKGFEDGLNAKRKGVKVVVVATTWDQTMAQNGVEAAMKANPKAKLVACAWDGGALGAMAALKAAGKKAGDVKIAGFDGSPGGLDMMKEGWQQANSAQMLAKIGKVGVESAIAAAQGKKVEKRIDTGSFLVLPANVDQFATDSGVGQFMKTLKK
jgi:ABC-type sugar transport system substrate-binding protein